MTPSRARPAPPFSPRAADPAEENRETEAFQSAAETSVSPLARRVEGGAPTLARPRAVPTICVGFLTPNLLLGGAEYWILGLLRRLDPRAFSLGGVAMMNNAPSELEVCREAASCTRIYGGPLHDCPADRAPDRCLVLRFPSLRDALAKVAADSDILIVWGLSHLDRYLGGLGFPGPIVLVSHGCGPATEKMLASSETFASHLVGVSAAAAASFHSKRVAVLHDGGDHERCRVTRSRDRTRDEWGALPTEKLVGYVGRFSWEKNPLAAARAVRRLGAGYRAVYIGSGWKEHEVKAAVLQLAPNAIFVPPVKQVGDALAALDAFVLASPSEGFSLSLTEAWLCGLPTVATRVGAIPELERAHGRLVVPVSVDASDEELSCAVRRALGEENRAVVERAREVAWRHYTADAMAKRWSDFLLQIYRPACPTLQ